LFPSDSKRRAIVRLVPLGSISVDVVSRVVASEANVNDWPTCKIALKPVPVTVVWLAVAPTEFGSNIDVPVKVCIDRRRVRTRLNKPASVEVRLYPPSGGTSQAQ